MSDFFKNISALVPRNANGDVMVPSGIKNVLSDVGAKGGQKYSNFIDKIVDSIFKKKK